MRERYDRSEQGIRIRIRENKEQRGEEGREETPRTGAQYARNTGSKATKLGSSLGFSPGPGALNAMNCPGLESEWGGR